ncbi:hypothetical protein ACH427_29535 [Streptomyces sp. NPDC020379]|uniref:hypothetical protein n=1 Tax=Streptomyces sp. NPDC020379 TaxID=3365071 RepID=UPI00378E2759
MQPNSDNTFRLRNDQPGLGTDVCLDVDPLSTATGWDIANGTKYGTKDSQHWFFAPSDPSTGPDEAGD